MSQEKSKNVEVILTLSADHYRMIKRCAKIHRIPVEHWILQATEGDLRGIVDDFDYIRTDIGFGDKEITAVVAALQCGGAV